LRARFSRAPSAAGRYRCCRGITDVFFPGGKHSAAPSPRHIFHLMKRDRHPSPRMIRGGTGPCGPAARLCARISWRGGFSSGIARADFLPCAPPEPDPAWENLSAPASRSGRAALFGIGMRSSAFHPVFIRSLPRRGLKIVKRTGDEGLRCSPQENSPAGKPAPWPPPALHFQTRSFEIQH